MKTLSDHAIVESWPEFVSLLDRDPDEAFARFYDYCWALLPRSSRYIRNYVPEDHREDVVSQTILHCWRDGQRVLRAYQPGNGSFAGWILRNACWQAQMYLRANRGPLSVKKEADEWIWESVADPRPLPPDQLAVERMLETVRSCIARLSKTCQDIFAATEDGLKPAEAAQALHYPPDSGKRIWNRLRACRRRLVQLLDADGVDSRSVTGLGVCSEPVPLTEVEA
jgi:RNA polymerase sigma factor (sigma-70 family)